MQVQAFVSGVDVRPLRHVKLASRHGLEEVERIGNRSDDRVIFVGSRRVADPAQIPVFRVMQVGKAAVDQRADEVQRQGSALVAAQYHLRIRYAVVGRETAPIDEVTAKARQRLAVARLGIGRARLGVLACHAADAHDRLLEPVDHDQAHLQQDLQLVDDVLGRALVEGLGAVAALQHERLATLRAGDKILERVDLPARRDRGEAAQVRDDAVQRRLVRVRGLLRRFEALPAGGMPVTFRNRSAHGSFVRQYVQDPCSGTYGPRTMPR